MIYFYQKVIIADPRDFCYLKQIKKIKETEEGGQTWCDASISIDDERYPVFDGKVRGNIIISGQYVEDCLGPNGKKRAFVRAYSEVDFKINLPVFLTKLTAQSEVKKYVEKSIERLKKFQKTNAMN